MDKLDMHTKNLADEQIEKLSELFPNVITEKEINGKTVRAIDFDALRQELSCEVVEGEKERYQLTWPNKRKSIILANEPTTNTLRPIREKSVDFDTAQNIYIEGDNIDALKIIQESYLGKINVIYIDPPYNTGNDILYVNDYSDNEDEFGAKYEVDSEGNRLYTNTDTNGRYHTNWLNMMYQRIKLSRNLLREDGFFLVAIDHYELANLCEICDDVFGFHNRIAIITVVHKPEGRNQAKFIGPSNEFMLVYAKNESKAKLQKVVLDESQSQAFECKDDKGAYRLKNFIRLADGKYATRESKPNFWYPIYVSDDLKELSLNEKENYVAVYPVTDSGVERTWKTTSDTFLNRYKNGDIIAKREKNKIVIYEKLREDQVIKTHWIDKKYHGYHYGTKLLDDLLGTKTFDFPKSLYLMRDIVKLFCPKDGIILDYFSGSATTAHATMMVNSEDNGNRKYILVQIPASCDEKTDAYKAGYKTICDIGEDRIRKALKTFDTGNASTGNNGVRVFKVDSSNMKDVYYRPADTTQATLDISVDNIKPDRTPEDLLFQVMLDLGVPLSSKIEESVIAGKKIFNVAERFLIACFDTEITDETVKAVAEMKPSYAVFRDSSMADDSVATNFEQIFESINPETKRRVL